LMQQPLRKRSSTFRNSLVCSSATDISRTGFAAGGKIISARQAIHVQRL
jgi:hypothetical protein